MPASSFKISPASCGAGFFAFASFTLSWVWYRLAECNAAKESIRTQSPALNVQHPTQPCSHCLHEPKNPRTMHLATNNIMASSLLRFNHPISLHFRPNPYPSPSTQPHPIKSTLSALRKSSFLINYSTTQSLNQSTPTPLPLNSSRLRPNCPINSSYALSTFLNLSTPRPSRPRR